MCCYDHARCCHVRGSYQLRVQASLERITTCHTTAGLRAHHCRLIQTSAAADAACSNLPKGCRRRSRDLLSPFSQTRRAMLRPTPHEHWKERCVCLYYVRAMCKSRRSTVLTVSALGINTRGPENRTAFVLEQRINVATMLAWKGIFFVFLQLISRHAVNQLSLPLASCCRHQGSNFCWLLDHHATSRRR